MALLDLGEDVGFEGVVVVWVLPVELLLDPLVGVVVGVVVVAVGVVVNGAVVPASTWIRVKVSVSVTTTPLSVPEQTATSPESEQAMPMVVRPWVKLTGTT